MTATLLLSFDRMLGLVAMGTPQHFSCKIATKTTTTQETRLCQTYMVSANSWAILFILISIQCVSPCFSKIRVICWPVGMWLLLVKLRQANQVFQTNTAMKWPVQPLTWNFHQIHDSVEGFGQTSHICECHYHWQICGQISWHLQSDLFLSLEQDLHPQLPKYSKQ